MLDDTHSRFSVDGYRERMDKSIGSIYLGLDAGAQYDMQSARANEAIRVEGYADTRIRYWSERGM